MKETINEIQDLRKSKVIAYITGDRTPINASIAEDVVRPMYEHLLKIGNQNKIDLFLYSRGGDVSVPWRIVSMIREFCKEFSVLIPYKAHSAATLLSLGADNIFMCKKAEFGPIDPTLKKLNSDTAGPPMEVSVEDVNSYISFIRDKANINDQSSLSNMVGILANHLNPLTLGKVNRQNSHIRLVARKLLTSRNEKADEAKISSIIETLTEKIYSHGHAIGRAEASEIGLPVRSTKLDLEDKLWTLFTKYESFLDINNPLDPQLILENIDEKKFENLPIAVIESEKLSHKFAVKLEFKKKRQIPNNPQFNINLNLNMPPNVPPDQLPQQLQQNLQGILNSFTPQIQKLVNDELKKQSPEIGIDVKAFGGKWDLY